MTRQMNGLYPIIRRLRRPLIVADDGARPAPPPPPVAAPPVVEGEASTRYGKRAPGRKGKDATTAANGSKG